MIKEKYKDIFKFAQKVLDSNIKPLHVHGQNANSLPKRVALYHYVRAFNLLWAIKILCEQGFAREGMILLRSLLNLYIDLKWLTTDDIDSRMERYADFEVIRKYTAIETLIELGEIPREEGIKDLENLRETYEKIKKKYGLKGNPRSWSWSGKRIRQMAEEVSLKKDYDIVYFYLSDREHTSPAAVRDYLDNSKNGYIVTKVGLSDVKIDLVILTALDYFLNVKEITLDIFNMDCMDLSSLKVEKQELSKLQNKYWSKRGNDLYRK